MNRIHDKDRFLVGKYIKKAVYPIRTNATIAAIRASLSESAAKTSRAKATKGSSGTGRTRASASAAGRPSSRTALTVAPKNAGLRW